MVTFNLRAKEFGLTYPEAAETTKEQVFQALLNTLVPNAVVEKVMVCEEVGHTCGRRHYHAYISFDKRIRANERTFDVFGLHCHIAKVQREGRSIRPMLKYLTKEDKLALANFDYLSQLVEEDNQDKKRKAPDWDGYALEGLTVDEVIERLALDGYSDVFANRYNNWIGYIKRRYIEKHPQVYVPIERTWKLPENLVMWKFQFLGWIDSVIKYGNEWTRPNNLVLVGPSRWGKTEWARQFGKHMYFNNLINLDDWNEDADYIVLDDFPTDFPKYFPCWKCFFGGQREFTLTDKYRGKKTVHWGKPMIWLSNESVYTHLNAEQSDFIRRNCTVICLNEKLF